MKAFEILRERTTTNEQGLVGAASRAAFAIGGVAFTRILTSVGAFLTAMTFVDLYRFIDNLGEDPEAATDDQWFDFFLDILLLTFPALAKYGKPYFAKLIPASLKKKAGDHVKGIVLKRYREERKAADVKFGKKAQAGAANPKAAQALKAKHAKAKQAAKVRAEKSLEKLSGDAVYKVALKAAGAGALASIAKNYWDQMSQIEEDWIAYQNGDRETETFGNMEPAEAEAHAYELKKKIWGQATIAIGSMIASASIAKRVEMFGGFFGRIVGGGLVGGVFKVPANIAAGIIRMGGPGIALFMQTDTGQKLLQNQVIEAITKMVGSVAVNTWETLKGWADQAAKAAGFDLGLDNKPTIQRPEYKDPDPWGIALTMDPKNPKLKFVGGDPVTDPNTGYLLTNIENQIQDIRRTARAAGKPDPTANIPRDPNGKYGNLPL